MLAEGLGWSEPRLYRNGPSLTTGDMLLEPLLHGVRQIHGPSAQINSRQAVCCVFQILDHISVICSNADFRNAEKPDQFFLPS